MGRGGVTVLDDPSAEGSFDNNSNSRLMQFKKKSVGGQTRFTNGMDEF
jgi:hypothetical protein